MPVEYFDPNARALLTASDGDSGMPEPLLLSSDARAPLFARRKASLPSSPTVAQRVIRRRGVSAPISPHDVDPPAETTAPPSCLVVGGVSRRRGLTTTALTRHQSAPSMKSRRRRKVTFQRLGNPEVAPQPTVESYDELLFNVAGLFHTTDFLHDPMEWEDDEPADDSSSCSGGSLNDTMDPEPPLERSVPLMIAEFLYRSAVYLGHPTGDEAPWLPGFREDKRFSGNDVKRWRRLAHFDWESEEREFQQQQEATQALATSVSSSEDGSVEADKPLGSLLGSFRLRRQSSAASTRTEATEETPAPKGKARLRRAVSGWIHKHRHAEKDAAQAAAAADAGNQDKHEEEEQERHAQKSGAPREAVSWLDPPPISRHQDLRLLVKIVNSCVYCGPFRFRRRDIVALCNVPI